MGGDDATPLAIAGLVIGFLEPRDYDVAVSAFDRSLALSNSSALALGFSAVTKPSIDIRHIPALSAKLPRAGAVA
jgi:hypothetical protein